MKKLLRLWIVISLILFLLIFMLARYEYNFWVYIPSPLKDFGIEINNSLINILYGSFFCKQGIIDPFRPQADFCSSFIPAFSVYTVFVLISVILFLSFKFITKK